MSGIVAMFLIPAKDSVVYGTLLSQIAPDECTYTLDELNAEADMVYFKIHTYN